MSILQNEQVQAALIALIVVGLNALAQWVRSKVSMTRIVDDYWCYIQQVAEIVRNEVADALKASTLSSSVLGSIVQRGVVRFVDNYKLNEGKEPTETQVKAAGGFSTIARVRQALDVGVARIGTSSALKLIKELSEERGTKGML